MTKIKARGTVIKIWSEDMINSPGEDEIIQIEHAYEDKYMVEVLRPINVKMEGVNDKISEDLIGDVIKTMETRIKDIPLN